VRESPQVLCHHHHQKACTGVDLGGHDLLDPRLVLLVEVAHAQHCGPMPAIGLAAASDKRAHPLAVDGHLGVKHAAALSMTGADCHACALARRAQRMPAGANCAWRALHGPAGAVMHTRLLASALLVLSMSALKRQRSAAV